VFCITEVESVYCVVRTESLYKTDMFHFRRLITKSCKKWLELLVTLGLNPRTSEWVLNLQFFPCRNNMPYMHADDRRYDTWKRMIFEMISSDKRY